MSDPCDPMDCSLPGSSVLGIVQARILEWVAISFSRGPSLGFPGDSAGKESTFSVGDLGSIPGLGRSPGKGKGYLLQYSGLQNSIDCIVHRVANSQTQLSDSHFTSFHLSLGTVSKWIITTLLSGKIETGHKRCYMEEMEASLQRIRKTEQTLLIEWSFLW